MLRSALDFLFLHKLLKLSTLMETHEKVAPANKLAIDVNLQPQLRSLEDMPANPQESCHTIAFIDDRCLSCSGLPQTQAECCLDMLWCFSHLWYGWPLRVLLDALPDIWI